MRTLEALPFIGVGENALCECILPSCGSHFTARMGFVGEVSIKGEPRLGLFCGSACYLAAMPIERCAHG